MTIPATAANEASRNETFVGPVDPAAAANAPVSAARAAPFCGASSAPNAPPTSRPATAYTTGRHSGGVPVDANQRRHPTVAPLVTAVPAGTFGLRDQAGVRGETSFGGRGKSGRARVSRLPERAIPGWQPGKVEDPRARVSLSASWSFGHRGRTTGVGPVDRMVG